MNWIDVTPQAARQIRSMLARDDRQGRYGLRVALAGTQASDGPGAEHPMQYQEHPTQYQEHQEYQLSLVPAARDDDLVLPRNGFDVFVAKAESDLLDGVRIDYVGSDAGSDVEAGFLVDRRPALRRSGAAPLTWPGGGSAVGEAAPAAPALGTSPELERLVAAALDDVRPVLVGDGGDVELVGVGDGVAYVRLQGACSGCGAALVTLTQLIETTVANAVPEVPRTVLVS